MINDAWSRVGLVRAPANKLSSVVALRENVKSLRLNI